MEDRGEASTWLEALESALDAIIAEEVQAVATISVDEFNRGTSMSLFVPEFLQLAGTPEIYPSLYPGAQRFRLFRKGVTMENGSVIYTFLIIFLREGEMLAI